MEEAQTIAEEEEALILPDYPSLLERVKAAFADSVILVIIMFLLSSVFSNMSDVPEAVRAVASVFVFILYEPIFVSFFGGTLGHRLMKLRIKRSSDHTKNVIVPFAIMRYFVKLFLGWVSFLTVSSNRKSQAIHDMAARFIVLYHDPQ